VNLIMRVRELRKEHKKKGGNVPTLLPPLEKLIMSLNNRVIRIIQLTLGCVELFFERGANEREPRNYQAT